MISENVKQLYVELEDKYSQIIQLYLTINDSNLDERMQRMASIYAFFSNLLAYSKYILDEAERELEVKGAAISVEVMTNLRSQGVKPSDNKLDAYIQSHEGYPALRIAVNEAAKKYNISKNIVDSLSIAKDMVIQLSSNRRAELKLN
jgi:predicted phage-related endonuclease